MVLEQYQTLISDFLKVYVSPYYSSEVKAAAAQISDSTLSAKALSVANIPTFTWFDSVSKVPDLGTYPADAQSIQQNTGEKQLVQIVVYDLPDRDCAAKASNGEFTIANNGQANYFNYIDQLVAQIKSRFHLLSPVPLFEPCAHPCPFPTDFPDVRVVAVIEPDSLANLVTNLNVQKCANAQTTYLVCELPLSPGIAEC